MNQRLEKEIFDFLTTQSVLQGERSNVREKLGLYDELTVQKCAEHFYNLAMEDVRKEVERRLKEWHCTDFGAEVEKGPSGDDGLLSWIDQQSK